MQDINIHEETRCGYKVTTLTKKIWNIQIKMVEVILEICKKHNLKIWAEGGTLLGAIRHNGFIPWDDDIDLMMFRQDYEKLIRIAPKELPDEYFLQCTETEPGYGRGHAQLRRNGTSAILPGDIWQSFHQGIFIDIFVFDFIPETNEECKNLFSRLEIMRRVLYLRNYGSLLSREWKTYLKSKNILLKNGGFRNYFNLMKSLIINNPTNSDNLVSIVMWTSEWYEKYTRDIRWYKETIYVPFESIHIPVPKEYDKVLRQQYGDYMTPVKAPTVHGNVIWDVHRSYKDVLRELRKKASIKQKLQHLFSFKSAID